MIQFTKPANLDGFYLKQELLNAGIKLLSKDILESDNKLFLDIDSKDEIAAAAVLEAHKGDSQYQE